MAGVLTVAPHSPLPAHLIWPPPPLQLQLNAALAAVEPDPLVDNPGAEAVAGKLHGNGKGNLPVGAWVCCVRCMWVCLCGWVGGSGCVRALRACVAQQQGRRAACFSWLGRSFLCHHQQLRQRWPWR